MLPMQELNLQTIDNLYETIRKNIANFQDILQEENRKLMNRDYANEEEKAEKEELIKEMEFAKTQSNNILRKIGQAREEYIKSKGNLRPDFITMFEQFGLSPSEQIHTKSRSELDLRKSAQMESDHHGADDDDVQVLRTSYVYHEEVSRSSPVLTSPNRSFHTSPAASPTKGGFTSPSSPRPENPRGSNSPSRAKPNSLADSPQRSPSKDLRSPNQFVTTTTTTTTSTPSRVTYVQEEYSYQSSQYVHQPSRSPRSPPSNEKDKLNLLELPSPPRRSLEEPKTHRNRILREEFKEETPKVFAIPKFDLEVREEVQHPEISRFTPSSARFPEERHEDEESESEEQQEEAIDQSYDEDYEEMELMELLKAQQQEQERRENRYARSSNQIPLDDSDEKVDEEDSLEDMDLEDIGISDTDRSMKELLDSLIPSSSVTTTKKETQDNKINEDLQRENTGLKQDIDSQRRDNEEMQARVKELLKTLNKKEDEITELRNSTKSQEQYISKLLKALKKKTSECNDIREERNKIRKIAESLAVHVESLQNTNLSVQNEQVQQQRELVDKHQKYSDAIETMVKKDNSLLKQYIDQMKRELQMRKTVFGEEILRLKKLVVETLEKDGDEELALGLSENEIMQTRDSSHLLASLNESASISLHQTIQNSWYTPTDSNDALDYAVNETLKIVNCPVRIEVERLGQGEYMVDRRLKLRVVNGQVVVRNGGMYETFVEYIRKLYRPFFTSQQLLDNGEELTDASIVDTSIEDLAASIQSELSRSGAKVAEEEESLLREAENSIQKFMFAREHSNQSSPTSKQRTPLKSDVQNVQSPPRITPQTRRDIKGSESPDGRSNSAPTKSRGSVAVSESQTRYTQILKAAAQKNKLTPIRNQAEKKPTVNSSKGRSSSPAQKLAPRVEKVATESGTKRKQSPYRQEYEQRQKAKEEKIQQSETTAVKIKLTKHTTSTKSSLLDGVDLNDRAKLEQLRRLALKKQIQQMNSRKL